MPGSCQTYVLLSGMSQRKLVGTRAQAPNGKSLLRTFWIVKKKEKLSEITQRQSQKGENPLLIRDPYVFDFVGLESREVMGESPLEDLLIDKLQEFLLELGHGFCFEAPKENAHRRRIFFCRPCVLSSHY